MAIAERNFVRDMTTPTRDGDVVLGDDWVAPDKTVTDELQQKRARRGIFSLRASPLTRKIITFNLIALNVLVAGILYLNSSRDSLAVQRGTSLVAEAELIADVFEAQLPKDTNVDLAAMDVAASLAQLDLRTGIEVFVLDVNETLLAQTAGRALETGSSGARANKTWLTDGLSWLWSKISSPFDINVKPKQLPVEQQLKPIAAAALGGGTQIRNNFDVAGGNLFTVATPILQNGTPIGVIAVSSAAGEIDRLVRAERERVLIWRLPPNWVATKMRAR